LNLPDPESTTMRGQKRKKEKEDKKENEEEAGRG
jgi:hypothetical protein